MYQLEIPYNFDKKLIDCLKVLDSDGVMYHAIYMPPFAEDYHSAKRYHVNQNFFEHVDMKELLYQTRDEYESHVSYINAAYPGRLMLLLQQPNLLISDKMLQYYIDLGFTKFCVNSKEQAKQIKAKSSEYEVICSIVHNISKEELESDPEINVFDAFVLPHCFNKDIDAIKALPKNYQYILLVNSDCSVHCRGDFHWLANQDQEANISKLCPRHRFQHYWKDITKIRPIDLPVFFPYLRKFKLLGREKTTSALLREIVLYTTSYKFLPNCQPDETLYKK